ncbi:class I SAM-dependent methyltransferase [Thermoflexibacter ruber]|uniref:Methyltransferase domain-containing protein n=1 Tax=Thermoflexibacter ruber TaxID=1003 RepID=A0A1I2J4I7_9BACT|nr:class I SAM-dependent methyltransferase [Thermoflexibacter ruber]SFF47836.1 Methyltransferase domain-containing protein [Thermoflexibacter ruber]
MQKIRFGFFIFLFNIACSSPTLQEQSKQSVAINPEKIQFLNQIQLYQHSKNLKYQLDSANISPEDIINFCRVSFDIERKTALIHAIRSEIPNNLQEINQEYWGGILYDLRRFMENISLLKQGNDKVFMDVGSGNGEKLYAALCLGFEKAIGIEYSPDLVKIAKESLQDFKQSGQIHAILADAFEVRPEIYAQADFIYLYSPIKDNELMAKLTYQIMQSMKNGAKLLEVRFVYRDELAKISNLDIPEMAGLFALKKENKQFYYAQYDQYQTKWVILPSK